MSSSFEDHAINNEIYNESFNETRLISETSWPNEMKDSHPSKESTMPSSIPLRPFTKIHQETWNTVYRKVRKVVCPVVACQVDLPKMSDFIAHYPACYMNDDDICLEECPLCNLHMLTNQELLLISHIIDVHGKNGDLAIPKSQGSLQNKNKRPTSTKRIGVGASPILSHKLEVNKKESPTTKTPRRVASSHQRKEKDDILVPPKEVTLLEQLEFWKDCFAIPDLEPKRIVSSARISEWKAQQKEIGSSICGIEGCRKEFKSFAGIMKHSYACGFNYTYFRCKLCNYMTRQQHGLLKHLESEHEKLKKERLEKYFPGDRNQTLEQDKQLDVSSFHTTSTQRPEDAAESTFSSSDAFISSFGSPHHRYHSPCKNEAHPELEMENILTEKINSPTIFEKPTLENQHNLDASENYFLQNKNSFDDLIENPLKYNSSLNQTKRDHFLPKKDKAITNSEKKFANKSTHTEKENIIKFQTEGINQLTKLGDNLETVDDIESKSFTGIVEDRFHNVDLRVSPSKTSVLIQEEQNANNLKNDGDNPFPEKNYLLSPSHSVNSIEHTVSTNTTNTLENVKESLTIFDKPANLCKTYECIETSSFVCMTTEPQIDRLTDQAEPSTNKNTKNVLKNFSPEDSSSYSNHLKNENNVNKQVPNDKLVESSVLILSNSPSKAMATLTDRMNITSQSLSDLSKSSLKVSLKDTNSDENKNNSFFLSDEEKSLSVDVHSQKVPNTLEPLNNQEMEKHHSCNNLEMLPNPSSESPNLGISSDLIEKESNLDISSNINCLPALSDKGDQFGISNINDFNVVLKRKRGRPRKILSTQKVESLSPSSLSKANFKEKTNSEELHLTNNSKLNSCDDKLDAKTSTLEGKQNSPLKNEFRNIDLKRKSPRKLTSSSNSDTSPINFNKRRFSSKINGFKEVISPSNVVESNDSQEGEPCESIKTLISSDIEDMNVFTPDDKMVPCKLSNSKVKEEIAKKKREQPHMIFSSPSLKNNSDTLTNLQKNGSTLPPIPFSLETDSDLSSDKITNLACDLNNSFSEKTNMNEKFSNNPQTKCVYNKDDPQENESFKKLTQLKNTSNIKSPVIYPHNEGKATHELSSEDMLKEFSKRKRGRPRKTFSAAHLKGDSDASSFTDSSSKNSNSQKDLITKATKNSDNFSGKKDKENSNKLIDNDNIGSSTKKSTILEKSSNLSPGNFESKENCECIHTVISEIKAPKNKNESPQKLASSNNSDTTSLDKLESLKVNDNKGVALPSKDLQENQPCENIPNSPTSSIIKQPIINTADDKIIPHELLKESILLESPKKKRGRPCKLSLTTNSKNNTEPTKRKLDNELIQKMLPLIPSLKSNSYLHTDLFNDSNISTPRNDNVNMLHNDTKPTHSTTEKPIVLDKDLYLKPHEDFEKNSDPISLPYTPKRKRGRPRKQSSPNNSDTPLPISLNKANLSQKVKNSNEIQTPETVVDSLVLQDNETCGNFNESHVSSNKKGTTISATDENALLKFSNEDILTESPKRKRGRPRKIFSPLNLKNNEKESKSITKNNLKVSQIPMATPLLSSSLKTAPDLEDSEIMKLTSDPKSSLIKKFKASNVSNEKVNTYKFPEKIFKRKRGRPKKSLESKGAIKGLKRKIFSVEKNFLEKKKNLSDICQQAHKDLNENAGYKQTLTNKNVNPSLAPISKTIFPRKSSRLKAKRGKHHTGCLCTKGKLLENFHKHSNRYHKKKQLELHKIDDHTQNVETDNVISSQEPKISQVHKKSALFSISKKCLNSLSKNKDTKIQNLIRKSTAKRNATSSKLNTLTENAIKQIPPQSSTDKPDCMTLVEKNGGKDLISKESCSKQINFTLTNSSSFLENDSSLTDTIDNPSSYGLRKRKKLSTAFIDSSEEENLSDNSLDSFKPVQASSSDFENSDAEMNSFDSRKESPRKTSKKIIKKKYDDDLKNVKLESKAPEPITIRKYKKRKHKEKSMLFKEEDERLLEEWKGLYIRPSNQELRKIPNSELYKWTAAIRRGGSAKCNTEGCGKKFTSLLGIKYHYERCTLSVLWVCKLCQTPCQSAKRLAHHLRSHSKNDKCMPTSSLLLRGEKCSLDELKQYVKRNLTAETHLQFKPRKNSWKKIKEEDEKEFLPPIPSSLPFVKVKFDDKNLEDKTWKTLRRFESCISTKDGLVESMIFAGGPIHLACWCPSVHPDANQYIAFVTPPDTNIYSEAFVESGLIQIWDMGSLKSSNSPKHQPYLALAFRYPSFDGGGGRIMDMKWCPGGCWENPKDFSSNSSDCFLPRLGLLAVGFQRGPVYIYEIPHPPCLSTSDNTSLPLYNATPRVILEPDEKNTTICRTIAWERSDGHKYFAAGYDTGIICFWLMDSNSPGLKGAADKDSIILKPFRRLKAHKGPVIGLEWVPASHKGTQPLFFISFGEDKGIKQWNLETESCMEINKGVAYSHLIWPSVWTGLFLVKMGYGKVDYVEYQQLFMMEEPMSFLNHAFGITSISFSEWNQCLASSDSSGQVMLTIVENDPSLVSLMGDKPLLKSSKIKPRFHTSKKLFCCQIHNFGNLEEQHKTYHDVAQNCGLVFKDHPLIKYPPASSKRSPSTKEEEESSQKLTDYLMSAVNTVAWNPNEEYNKMLFIGSNSGLGRILHIVPTDEKS